MKGTGRQSVLKPHRKLETITHGHRAAKIRRTLSGKRRPFGQICLPQSPLPPFRAEGSQINISSLFEFPPCRTPIFGPCSHLVMIPTRCTVLGDPLRRLFWQVLLSPPSRKSPSAP